MFFLTEMKELKENVQKRNNKRKRLPNGGLYKMLGRTPDTGRNETVIHRRERTPGNIDRRER